MAEQTKFLEDLKSKRNDRQQKKEVEQKKENAAITIQRIYRGWLARVLFKRRIL